MAPDPWRGLSFRGGGAVRLGLLAHWLIRQAADDPLTPPDLARALLGQAFEHFQVLSAYDGYAAVNPDPARRQPERRAVASDTDAGAGRGIAL